MSLYKKVMDQVTLNETMQKKLKGLYQSEVQGSEVQGRDCGERRQSDQQAKKHGTIAFRRFVVTAATVAACAAVTVAFHVDNAGEERKDAASNNSTSFMEAQTEAVSEYEHVFTLKALASDRDVAGGVVMEKGKPVIVTGTWGGGNYGQKSSESDEISYRFVFKFLCEGAHIEKITYSVNKGVLQICQPKDRESIAIEAEPAPYKDYGMSIHAEDDVTEYWWDDLDDQVYYSYTVAYDRQTAPYTDFSVCGEKKMNDIDVEGLRRPEGVTWPEYEVNSRYVNAMKQMVGDIIITCTVYYDDGTSENADIKIIPKVMTLEEAGFGERYPETSKEDLATKQFFIAYELQ
ncbi:MAG: hypothetical protein IJ794_06725 [Lachnospiraceae bacterium]|nr:hypothetical protein [Lachnospiraceae bacterium]